NILKISLVHDFSDPPKPSLKLLSSWPDVFEKETVELSCEVNIDVSSGWKYWFRDGIELRATTETHKIPIPSLKLITAWIDVFPTESVKIRLTQDPEYKVMFPGESVSFSCHINGSFGWTYMWYKDSVQLNASGSKYSLNSVKTSNRGAYECRAKRGSDQAFLTDVRKQPKPLMTQQPDVEKVYTGESVSFECKVELSSGWAYHWYKDGTQLPINTNSFNIRDANLTNGGAFVCLAIRDKTMYKTQPSDGRILRVSEIPVPSLKLITPWLDVFPTESVKFNCWMDGSTDWKYMWFKDSKLVLEDNTASFNAATLSISSASASHHGRYSCSGKLKSRTVSSVFSEGLTLDVYGEDFFPSYLTTNHLFQLNSPLCLHHCRTIQFPLAVTLMSLPDGSTCGSKMVIYSPNLETITPSDLLLSDLKLKVRFC
uniref:Ig-like domain-containing protein n=1 Tax=Cyclopterus lumpus TaxID=8103 RepID=A0A8C2ZIF9_CYCLU